MNARTGICIIVKESFGWRWSLILVAVWFVIVDLIRKTMEGTQSLLIVSDVLVLSVFCVFFIRYYLFMRRSVHFYLPKHLKLLLFVFGFIVIIQSLNPTTPDFILRIAGLRTYIFYVPAVGLGLFFLQSTAALKGVSRFLLILTLPVILLSIYQVASDPASLSITMTSMDHNVHSYGRYNFDLIPATFASSRRFGRFLFLVYPFVYGIAAYRNKPRLARLGFLSLFMTAAIISGSREIVVLLLLFHIMFWVLTSKGKLKKYAISFLLFISLIVTWATILNFDSDDITEENYRIRAILSSQEDWKFRFKIYLQDAFLKPASKYSGSELIWGTGVGTYGQETFLIGDQDYTRSLGINRMAGDAGVTKLLVELGIMGFLYFMMIYFIILKVLWQRMKPLKGHKIYPLAMAVYFIPIGWLILFLKAHTVISDGMMSFGLWFSVGFILALAHYGATGYFPVSVRKAVVDNAIAMKNKEGI